jgi:hypothetical protein
MSAIVNSRFGSAVVCLPCIALEFVEEGSDSEGLQVTGRDVRLTAARPPRESHFPAKTNEVKRSIIWGSSQLLSHVSSSSQQTAGRTRSSVSRVQSVRRLKGNHFPKESHSFPKAFALPSLPFLYFRTAHRTVDISRKTNQLLRFQSTFSSDCNSAYYRTFSSAHRSKQIEHQHDNITMSFLG